MYSEHEILLTVGEEEHLYFLYLSEHDFVRCEPVRWFMEAEEILL